VPVQGLDNIADVATGVGNFYSGGPWALALRADGTVWSWGANGGGNLGDGTQTAHYPPAKITTLPPIHAIAVGDSFALALDDPGRGVDLGLRCAVSGPTRSTPAHGT